MYAPPVQGEVKDWVDETFNGMTIEERIAQLMMIEVRPTYGAKHLEAVQKTINDFKVGGLIFFKGEPEQQVQLTNQFQKSNKTPMLIAIDGEWGLSMRLSNTTEFPYQLGLGSIQDNNSIYLMGREIGRQCKRMGIHINFAPVVDVNNNPNNPVINYRSFGEDPDRVARKGWAYAHGMQDEGVIACAKHFPGHGDTDVDSHKDLPVINHSMERLEKVEFVPFRYLINNGVQSIMTAHLYIPAIDSKKKTAISISEKAINGILREDMGFQGLAITDALNMQGVAKYHKPGQLELKALKAGNDILLAPSDVGMAIQVIKKALKRGQVDLEYFNNKVKKILAYKESVGLSYFTEIPEQNLLTDLNSTKAQYVNSDLVEKQLCLVRDQWNILPFRSGSANNIASVAIGDGVKKDFQTELSKYGVNSFFQINKSSDIGKFNKLKEQLSSYDAVIVSLHNTSKYPPSYGITGNTSKFVNALNQSTKTIMVDFGNPYNLKNFLNLKTILMAYQDRPINHAKAAQALFGGVNVNGTLPVSIGTYVAGEGVELSRLNSLVIGTPEEVGLSASRFLKIDDIVQKALDKKAMPGCQVLVAKDGKIIYEKSYGYHSYAKKTAVRDEHLYDIASITKVAATTISIMKLVEDNIIGLDDRLSDHLPVLIGTNMEQLTIREILEHKAGLKGWIPFYLSTTLNRTIYDSIYSRYQSDLYSVYVGNDLYMRYDYKDAIMQQIFESEISNRGKYRYSDLGMIMLKEMIEKVTGKGLDTYVYETFYNPLGIYKLTYKPLERFTRAEIVPTEFSPDMRPGLVHGDVHDAAAAMLGGISGHAGLFSNVESLAILMQMMLNGGTYNGTRFLNKETIYLFTTKHSKDSRRGIGWDKPEPNKKRSSPTSKKASPLTYGHTGFTGTMVWADPKYDLIYVFLSNRVHPTSDNKKLIRMNVRTEIMDVIYDAMLNP